MFDLPHRHWINFIYLGVMAGGAGMAHQLPGSYYDFIGSLFATAGVIMIAGNEWCVGVDKQSELKSLSILDRTQEARDFVAFERANHAPEVVKPRINDWTGSKQVIYNQMVAPVKIDLEREFCKALVDMKRGGFDMNISETYWLKGGRWKGTPTEFIGMRSKFEYYHIFGKKGNATNSPFVVLNVQAVEMRADGKLKLPTPPGM